MASVMRHTMVVRNPNTMEAVALLAGEPVPDWVTDELVHPDNLESAKAAKAASSDSGSGSGADDKGYAGKTPEELTAEAESRGLAVTGTGKGGNVLKGDLVAALEAHDAANA